jgi:photosystem II stability/assembly factor-like uncharacterized protein
MKNILTLSFCLLTLFSCQEEQKKSQNTDNQEVTEKIPTWEAQKSNTDASLRGLSAVSEKIAWASGSKGMVTHTSDAGQTWQADSIVGYSDFQFRDIEAFDASTAIVLSAGSPAKIFKTTDGGKTWDEKYTNEHEGIFFDAMAFWDEQNGIAFSDPIDGKLFIIRTEDGGETWEQIPSENLPPVKEGEAGFAASGTCLAVQGNNNVWIGTGGAVARVFHSKDKGNTWEVYDTPLASGASSKGIFSIAFKDENNGIIVGGIYDDDKNATKNMALTSDGGKTWTLVSENQPQGYRSCVTYYSNDLLFAVGTSGSDFSRDGGKNWQEMDTTSYHSSSLSKDKKTLWVSGENGRISKLDFK